MWNEALCWHHYILLSNFQNLYKSRLLQWPHPQRINIFLIIALENPHTVASKFLSSPICRYSANKGDQRFMSWLIWTTSTKAEVQWDENITQKNTSLQYTKNQRDFNVPLAQPKSRQPGVKIRAHRNYIYKNQIHFESKHRLVQTALYNCFSTYRI